MLIKPINIIIVTSFLILIKIIDNLPKASLQSLEFYGHTNTTNVKFSPTNFNRQNNRQLQRRSLNLKKRKKHNYCFCNQNPLQRQRNKFADIFTEFWSYSKIEQYLKYVAKTYPNSTKLESLGKTLQNNTIYSITIGLVVEGNNIVFIEAGTHAKEWGSIMMALYIIYALVECDLYQNLGIMDWIIIPVVNPDGYDYSFKHPKHRMWNKNRRSCENEMQNKTKCVNNCGVDINKNFPYLYGWGSGSSSDPCSDFYDGLAAASETETNVTAELLSRMKNRIKLYLGIHTYGALILYPYAAIVKEAENAQELKSLAKYAVAAINKHSTAKEPYAFGSYAERVVPEAGTCLDYVKGSLHIQYAYYINLRGPYNMAAKDILPTVSECFYGICAMARRIYENNPASKRYLRKWKGYRRRRRTMTNSADNDKFSCYILGAAAVFRYVSN